MTANADEVVAELLLVTARTGSDGDLVVNLAYACPDIAQGECWWRWDWYLADIWPQAEVDHGR